jgi:hypothetical protein
MWAQMFSTTDMFGERPSETPPTPAFVRGGLADVAHGEGRPEHPPEWTCLHGMVLCVTPGDATQSSDHPNQGASSAPREANS